jgi:biotin carboxyl carrier protein
MVCTPRFLVWLLFQHILFHILCSPSLALDFLETREGDIHPAALQDLRIPIGQDGDQLHYLIFERGRSFQDLPLEIIHRRQELRLTPTIPLNRRNQIFQSFPWQVNHCVTITAPFTARVIRSDIETDQEVNVGDCICILEAMKMEMRIQSNRAGRIKEVFLEANSIVEQNAPLVSIANWENINPMHLEEIQHIFSGYFPWENIAPPILPSAIIHLPNPIPQPIPNGVDEVVEVDSQPATGMSSLRDTLAEMEPSSLLESSLPVETSSNFVQTTVVNNPTTPNEPPFSYNMNNSIQHTLPDYFLGENIAPPTLPSPMNPLPIPIPQPNPVVINETVEVETQLETGMSPLSDTSVEMEPSSLPLNSLPIPIPQPNSELIEDSMEVETQLETGMSPLSDILVEMEPSSLSLNSLPIPIPQPNSELIEDLMEVETQLAAGMSPLSDTLVEMEPSSLPLNPLPNPIPQPNSELIEDSMEVETQLATGMSPLSDTSVEIEPSSLLESSLPVETSSNSVPSSVVNNLPSLNEPTFNMNTDKNIQNIIIPSVLKPILQLNSNEFISAIKCTIALEQQTYIQPKEYNYSLANKRRDIFHKLDKDKTTTVRPLYASSQPSLTSKIDKSPAFTFLDGLKWFCGGIFLCQLIFLFNTFGCYVCRSTTELVTLYFQLTPLYQRMRLLPITILK